MAKKRKPKPEPTPDPAPTWPARIIALRESKGWDRSTLAAKLGLAERTLYYYELGRQDPPPPVAILIEHYEAERLR
jgi:transcriptional regulator with XRE-family HTH domain